MIVCAEVGLEDFYVIHHEMGHIQYYMLFQNQPTIFQDANSALQEAIGDAIFNGVMVPQHLVRLGLLDDRYLAPVDSVEEPVYNIMFLGKRFRHPDDVNTLKIEANADIALLLTMALAKLPQIPFEYLLDDYRYGIFEGSVPVRDYNERYWSLLAEEQGVQPPPSNLDRRRMFEAGSKFHVADNTPYVRYFLASIMQAQIFKGLCLATLYDNPAAEQPMILPLHRYVWYPGVEGTMKPILTRLLSQ